MRKNTNVDVTSAFCFFSSATYCIGIFALMLLSLLETILVMYLMEKDSAHDDEADREQSLDEDCQKIPDKCQGGWSWIICSVCFIWRQVRLQLKCFQTWTVGPDAVVICMPVNLHLECSTWLKRLHITSRDKCSSWWCYLTSDWLFQTSFIGHQQRTDGASCCGEAPERTEAAGANTDADQQQEGKGEAGILDPSGF